MASRRYKKIEYTQIKDDVLVLSRFYNYLTDI
jgi:hypothetical protein